jgi:hypothetical protein
MTLPTDLTGGVLALLAKAGLDQEIVSIDTCSNGGNNRAYRVQTRHGIFAVKQYFRHEGDRRDRLDTEFKFLTYADHVATGFAPKPYVKDDAAGIALYEFVDGQAFSPGDVGRHEVRRAAEFFQALNQDDAREQSRALPFASEACFSIKDHIELISERIAALAGIVSRDDEDSQLETLVQKLLGHWREMVAELSGLAHAARLDVNAYLEESQRCVSPSDFGFHNALREAGGGIRFLDFEYAGRDDPAKMAGDFFAQLAVPVPDELFGEFVKTCFAHLPFADDLILRAQLLRPVYRVKWCCIALNVFLPTNIARRQFANPNLDVSTLKRAQLAKAYKIYQSFGEINLGIS